MGDLSVSGRTSVNGLQSQFKKSYGLELRVYKGNRIADGKATLASLSDKKVDDFKCTGRMKVGNFETQFEAATGLNVRVAVLPDAKVEPGKLVNKTFTLSQSSAKFGVM